MKTALIGVGSFLIGLGIGVYYGGQDYRKKGEATWDGRDGGRARNIVTRSEDGKPTTSLHCDQFSQRHVVFTWRPSPLGFDLNHKVKDLTEKLKTGFTHYETSYPPNTDECWKTLNGLIDTPSEPDWVGIINGLSRNIALPEGWVVNAFTDTEAKSQRKYWAIEFIKDMEMDSTQRSTESQKR
jgi:hypothetical protein